MWDALAEAGAVVEARSYGETDVLLPDGLARQLGVASMVTLTFDSEVHRDHPETLLVSYGHPLVDALIGYTLRGRRGFCQYVEVTTAELDAREARILALAAQRVHFEKCRAPKLVATRPIVMNDFAFAFRLQVQSAARIEESVTVWLDGRGLQSPEFAAHYGRRLWESSCPPSLAQMMMAPPEALDRLYVKARSEALAIYRFRGAMPFVSDPAYGDRIGAVSVSASGNPPTCAGHVAPGNRHTRSAR